MTDPIEARAALAGQLKSVDYEMQKEIRRRSSQGWGLGPIRFEASSGIITIGYIAFHAACFVIGIVLITLGGIPRDVGIAVVVGALFAFGSFMAQWWAVVVQREISVRDAADQESDAALWRELTLRRARISRQIEAFNATQLMGDEPEGRSNSKPPDP